MINQPVLGAVFVKQRNEARIGVSGSHVVPSVPCLPGRSKRPLGLGDPLLIPLVERPLLDPLGAHEPSLRQNPQVLTRRRLTDAEFLRDEHAAHAIPDEVAVDLPRKVRAGLLEPVEDLQAAFVGERLDGSDR
jgi:hypothetical protein